MSLQVELLEQSFAPIEAQSEAFTDSFYENMFSDYPEAQPLFAHVNMAKQKKQLFGSLVFVVKNLRNPDALTQALHGLGARHIKYGTLPEHYPLIGNNLLKTFGQYLGEEWTAETQQAWSDAYAAIAALMLEGAEHPSEIATV